VKEKGKHACEKNLTQNEYKSPDHPQEDPNINQRIHGNFAIEKHGNDQDQNRKGIKPLSAHSRIGDSVSKEI